MIFKKGCGWKACYDEEIDLYTGMYDADGTKLFEITKEIFDSLKDGLSNYEAQEFLSRGRKLYMDVCDRCGPPYTIVFDEDYQKLCPWAEVSHCGEEWPTEMVDAVVEVLDSEKDNRGQRRKKREERNAKNSK